MFARMRCASFREDSQLRATTQPPMQLPTADGGWTGTMLEVIKNDEESMSEWRGERPELVDDDDDEF